MGERRIRHQPQLLIQIWGPVAQEVTHDLFRDRCLQMIEPVQRAANPKEHVRRCSQ